MKKQFTTGQFAKLANVSERTIRYYDKTGLLKPTFVMENGYRKYCEDDFIKLQKIISLKHFGFSLDDIKTMVVHDNVNNMKDSLDLQIQLLDKKIKHLALLKEAMMKTKSLIHHKQLDWNSIIQLTQLCSQGEKIVEHYRDSTNLSVRIKLHQQYSTNKKGWFLWLYEQINFKLVNRLLEIGCGDGTLWKNKNIDVRNREIFLSDVSQGMLDTAKKALGDDFSYMVIDCENISFRKDYFDSVVANHMLFYVHDLHEGLSEIKRVLKYDGILYCSTYGKQHMKEMTLLVQEFDNRITLSDNKLYDTFGLENGAFLLEKYFKHVRYIKYEDSLIVHDAQAVYDYIISCHGNQNEILSNRTDEFKAFLKAKISKEQGFYITKDAGLFICRK